MLVYSLVYFRFQTKRTSKDFDRKLLDKRRIKAEKDQFESLKKRLKFADFTVLSCWEKCLNFQPEIALGLFSGLILRSLQNRFQNALDIYSVTIHGV